MDKNQQQLINTYFRKRKIAYVGEYVPHTENEYEFSSYELYYFVDAELLDINTLSNRQIEEILEYSVNLPKRKHQIISGSNIQRLFNNSKNFQQIANLINYYNG